jgi:hypothetical protein
MIYLNIYIFSVVYDLFKYLYIFMAYDLFRYFYIDMVYVLFRYLYIFKGVGCIFAKTFVYLYGV